MSTGRARLDTVMYAEDISGDVRWDAEDPFALIGHELGKGRVIQPKYDGWRYTLTFGARRNELSGNIPGVIDNFPPLRDAVYTGLAGTVLDGEMTGPKPRTGQPKWSTVTGLLNSSPEDAIATQMRKGHGFARFIAFDILAVNGDPATSCTYAERREMLTEVVRMVRGRHPDCRVELAPEWPATRGSIWRALNQDHEGVMIKAEAGRYYPGKRTRLWLKVKRTYTVDAWVSGWTPGKDANAGKVGSVEVSVLGVSGRPVAVGSVGNLKTAWRDLITLHGGGLDPAVLHTVIECRAQGVTAGGRLRHPVMLRVRTDKPWQDCDIGQLNKIRKV